MMRHAAAFLLVLCGLSWISWARQGQPAKELPRERRVYRELSVGDGPKLRYALVTPEGWKEGDHAKALLALPPGGQNESMAEMGLSLYWEAEAKKRGWVVAAPIAREGVSLTQDEDALAAMAAELARLTHADGGMVHVAGVSNGGKSALRLAVSNPDHVASLLLLPGAPASPEDWAKLDKLKGIAVSLYVGGDDRAWLLDNRKLESELKQLGSGVTLHVVEGQGHVLKLDPAALFSELERMAPRAPVTSKHAEKGDAAHAISVVLDDFHDAAAKADFNRYFAHYTDDGVFLGTDATERWTLPEFKAFAKPYFDKGTGWKYTSKVRHISLTPDGNTAWFDELLDNAKLGECRGSGVLILVGEEWKVSQYNLSIPIPNALAEGFAKTIAEEAKKAGEKK